MITDYHEACRYLDRVGHGTIKTKDGRVVKGTLTNIESEWDDPDGIGAVYIKTGPDYGEIVFANEFECLLEEGEEG